MTRNRFADRCNPVSLTLFLAIGAFLLGVSGARGSSGPTTVAHSSNGVSASVRSIQPAIHGLFQLQTSRTWADAIDESGRIAANGVPDILDTWPAYRSRIESTIFRDDVSAEAGTDSSILIGEGRIGAGSIEARHDFGNAYAFTTRDELQRELLYAGVDRPASGGPSQVVFEFNKERFSVGTDGSIQGERAIGDFRIVADLDADGCTVRFESYSLDEAEGIPKFASLATLVGDGCNESGTVCAVANGGLLEVGLNLSETDGKVARLFGEPRRGSHRSRDQGGKPRCPHLRL